MTAKQQINWIDMVVPNPEVVANFYASVIGYTVDPIDEGDGCTSYSLLDRNSKEAFGICDQKAYPAWTGGWVLYIEVDNFTKRVSQVEEQGGTIIGQWESEDGSRRECLIKDPSGAGVMLQNSSAAKNN